MVLKGISVESRKFSRNKVIYALVVWHVTPNLLKLHIFLKSCASIAGQRKSVESNSLALAVFKDVSSNQTAGLKSAADTRAPLICLSVPEATVLLIYISAE